MGGAVESIGKHLEKVNKLYKFRNEFLIQSQAERLKLEQKGILLEEKEEKAAEDKNKKWWRRFLDQKSEDESEKASKKPEDAVDRGSRVIKKALSPLQKFFAKFSPLLEAFIRLTVVQGVLDWITDQKTSELAKTIGNVVKIFNFVRKLVGFGIGSLLDGLGNLFGGIDKIRQGNIAGALQSVIGVGQFLAGVALVKGAQYIMMPWKLISDVGWVMKLFTEWGKINGEAEGAAANKDIAGYVDKNGNQISKEDFEKAKKSAARNDTKRAKRQGKGWAYMGGQDAVTDRYRAQYGRRDKNFMQRGAQRTRIGFKRATRGVRGQFKAAGNWMAANPAKGNAIFSVVGGLARAGGGLMSGENAGQAVGAGLGQATGGIAGFALGNMLLPGVGGIIGSALGSFLGEWVGTKLGPIIDPIMKPLGNAFKLGFDIIGTAISPILNTFGEFLGAIVDGIGGILQLSWWLAKAGGEVIKFAWENSIYKKAIDGMIWVWQNKDNISGAVRDALTQGAKGTLDALTFNVFDFDKQNKRFAGGRVPLMAAGGILKTDSPEVLALKIAGSTLISTVEGALGSFGLVGDLTRSAMSSDLSRIKGVFGGVPVSFGGGRIATQVTKPSGEMRGGGVSERAGDDRLASIVGTSEVRFLTSQPDEFKPMNDGSMRGLLADIYNGLVSLKVLGGNNVVTPGPGGPDPTVGNIEPGPMHQKGASIAKELMRLLGIKDFQAAAIVGNLIQESSLVPDRIQGSGMKRGPLKVDGVTGYSYPQWTSIDRQRAFAAYMESKGHDWRSKGATDELATGFLAKEFKGYMSSVFTNTTSVGAASNWVLFNYEKPADQGSTEQSERATDAAAVLAKMAIGGKFKYNSLEEYLESKGKTAEQIRKALTIQDVEGTELKKKYAAGGIYNYNLIPGQAYGASRDNGARQHAGQDLDISGGEAVQTFGGGVVAGVYGQNVGDFGYGKYIDIWNDRLKVVERIAELGSYSVKKGDVLRPGQIIGSGETQTGVAHIEVRPMAKYAEKYGFAGTRNPLEFWKSVGAASDSGGNKIKVTSEVTGSANGLPPDVAAAGGGSTGRTSLLGGGTGSAAATPGDALEQALKKWAEAFGGSKAEAPPAPTLPAATTSPSTSSSQTTQQVQSSSETFTSREATKPKGGVAVATVPIPVGVGGSQPASRIVLNKPIPTAMLS
jgi:hypothetical protein